MFSLLISHKCAGFEHNFNLLCCCVMCSSTSLLLPPCLDLCRMYILIFCMYIFSISVILSLAFTLSLSNLLLLTLIQDLSFQPLTLPAILCKPPILAVQTHPCSSNTSWYLNNNYFELTRAITPGFEKESWRKWDLLEDLLEPVVVQQPSSVVRFYSFCFYLKFEKFTQFENVWQQNHNVVYCSNEEMKENTRSIIRQLYIHTRT